MTFKTTSTIFYTEQSVTLKRDQGEWSWRLFVTVELPLEAYNAMLGFHHADSSGVYNHHLQRRANYLIIQPRNFGSERFLLLATIRKVVAIKVLHVQQLFREIVQEDRLEIIAPLFPELAPQVHFADVSAPADELDFPALLKRTLGHLHEAVAILGLSGVASGNDHCGRLLRVDDRFEDLEM